MRLPAAKSGDKVLGIDIHVVMAPSPGGPVPTPLPHPFAGILMANLSSNVLISGLAAATVGSVAANTPVHIPTPPGAAFQKPPSNRSTIRIGSHTVRINGKFAARAGDVATTCNDPADLPAGRVVAAGTVMIG
jgi:uncharacterized Zn-binding protein involved in type VI secretion